MLSYSQKKARTINLDAKYVLVKGKNHVGKSCVLKSLYRSLGAEIKRMSDRWNKAAIVLLLYFSIDDVRYKSLLIGNDVIIINPDDTIRFKEKVGSAALYKKMSMLLGVNLSVLDDKTSNIPIAACYMPFYIDQDMGWTETWSSFSNVGNLYEKTIVRLYLTGIIDDNFFSNKKTLASIEKNIKNCAKELQSYKILSDQVRKRLRPLEVNTDIEGFKNRVNSYLEKLKQLRNIQNEHLRLMQMLYAKKAYIEMGVEQLRKNICEIEKDFQYALELDDVIICPTCGARYTNNMQSRHGLVKDSHECKDLLIHCSKELDDINHQIDVAEEKSNDINASIESIQDIIKSSNDGISIEDVVEARSREQIVDLVKTQQAALSDKYSQLIKDKKDLESLIKNYEGNDRKKEAESLFVDYVTKGTRLMNLSVNREKIRFGCKMKATGSALPVNIIAHTFSYLKLMQKYSGPLFMPVVIDEPKQQGLQQQTLGKAISYMLDSIPANGQLIISLADDEEISTSKDSLIIDLDKSEGLLIRDDFEIAREEIEEILDKDFVRDWK